jgi:hypothetical protein
MKNRILPKIRNPPNSISRVRLFSSLETEKIGTLGELDFFAVINKTLPTNLQIMLVIMV